MDALELSLRCSALLVRSVPVIDTSSMEGATSTHETQWSEADYEKHFDEHGKFGEVLPLHLLFRRFLITYCFRTLIRLFSLHFLRSKTCFVSLVDRCNTLVHANSLLFGFTSALCPL